MEYAPSLSRPWIPATCGRCTPASLTWTDIHKDIQTETERQTEKQTYRDTHRDIERDRQTDRHTETHTQTQWRADDVHWHHYRHTETQRDTGRYRHANYYKCILYFTYKKIAHTRLPSVGFRSWSRFLAVSLQVTRVINPAVGCHYFSPGLQLPPQPLRGLLPISLLSERRHDACEQFA